MKITLTKFLKTKLGDLSLTKKMVFCFVLVILVATAGFSYTIFGCSQAERSVTDLQGKVPRMQMNNNIASNAIEESSNLRAYILYGDEKYLNEYQRLANENIKLENLLIKEATTDTSHQLSLDIQTLDANYTKTINDKLLPLLKAGNKDEALKIAVNDLEPLASQLLAKVEKAKSYREDTVNQAMNNTYSNAKWAKKVSIMCTFLVAILGILIGLLAAHKISAPIKVLQGLMAKASKGDLTVKAEVTTKDEIGQLCESFNTMISSQFQVVKSVQESASQLTVSSEEMAASSTQVSTSTVTISERIQKVAEAMEVASNSSTETSQVLIELSSLIQIAKDKAESASIKSQTSLDAARNGKNTVDEVMQIMNTIYDKTKEAEKVIALLNEYSQQIGMINATITGIADQTNLLALNAAIEAARAGESGRGFAVVAEEVRKLSEQSNAEASNISQLISKITENTNSAVVAMKHNLSEVESGVEEVNKAGKSLDNILAAVKETMNNINGIADITNDEVASSDKIVRLIEVVAGNIESTGKDAQEVSSATEETTTMIETVASNSEETSAMAQTLENLIEEFKVS